ncbi:hypothetical protein GDO86_008531 [Hymenochirus boettgeri]|uniref:Uncharacterized protein n=1 Tax=Hymenochirus boettgeri TaxID=247094 RepID=A0A8T2IY33_9PIPI|nr:hypothetical protein GDO86_008531 [Hymenochirus boettgeri]
MFLFILIFHFAIPLMGSSKMTEQDALCGPSDACYAVFYQRNGFLESWRACRERGGNLATVKSDQEAALIEQLVTASMGKRGDEDRLQQRFWIGLQRQPRQCAPQKPLRGFTWTTGDQDTAFTNWALQSVSLAPQGSCSAPRCVAIGVNFGIPEDDFKWWEGSCTLPVEGFVCKFRYQGMCPTLSESSVSYSVPFGYQGTWLDSLPFGSVASVACEGQHQDVSVLCMLKEDGTVGWNLHEPLCHAPDSSKCDQCEQICRGGGVCDCEEGYHLQPDGRSCELEDEMSFEEHDTEHRCPCEYRCLSFSGKGYQCICPKGYDLADDGYHCEDIDECEEGETGPCEHSCQNTLGSYICSCDLGFSISEDEPRRCVDVDECQFAGVCQQMCVNYEGGFECFCTDGYELDADRVSCRQIGHRETRYEPSLPDRPSDEVSEEQHGVYYQGEVDREHFVSEWEIRESATVNANKWESSDNTDSQYDWEDEVDNLISTAQADLRKATTITPLEEWEEVTLAEVSTTDKSTDIISEEDMESVIFTTSMAAQKTTVLVNQGNKMTANFQTTSLGSSSTTSGLPEKRTTDRSSVIATTKAPSTSLKHSLEKDDMKFPWKRHEVPSALNPNGNTATTLGPDNSLADVPFTGHQFIKNSSEVTNSVLSTFSPLPPQESTSKRDNRWLVVALLVPLCVFLVVMLALGIVYCTRCGGNPKPHGVTDCYNWMVGERPEKGLSTSGGETPCTQAAV